VALVDLGEMFKKKKLAWDKEALDCIKPLEGVGPRRRLQRPPQVGAGNVESHALKPPPGRMLWSVHLNTQICPDLCVQRALNMPDGHECELKSFAEAF